jgi:transcriptional regulator with XRE-family HTH domain
MENKPNPEIQRLAREKIGQALKMVAKKRGLSQRDIAEQTELPLQTVSNILNGNANYTFDSFVAVCQVLKVHFELHELGTDHSVWNEPPISKN